MTNEKNSQQNSNGVIKGTDWSVADSVNRTQQSSTHPTGRQLATVNPESTSPIAAAAQVMPVSVEGETPDGLVAQYQQKRLSRKATVQALKLRYESELDALQHRLNKACQIEKARADVMADEYLKELDAKHLKVLSDLGLRNKETREAALLRLTESTVERLKEVQNKDWPPSLIDETIQEIFALRKRAVAEIMNEVS